MHNRLLLALGVAAAALPAALFAQDVRVYSGEGGRAFSFATEGEANRAVIGVTTSTGSVRDTLGVLVSSITAGGPAEKAGLEEGNRIATINGVNLKLSAVDVGDWEMSSAMSRRLTRELGKLKPGDEADLRVYGGGQTRAVKVKTVSSDSLYPSLYRMGMASDDRAVLGISLGSSGSARDTLGVLISGLNDEGPAAKAGLEEGNRVAALNGVNLRVNREDAGDEFMSSAMVRRLQRELEKVKAGDEVTLRVYVGAGRTRDVKLRTVEASSIQRRGSVIIGGSVTPRAPMSPRIQMDSELLRRLETERSRVAPTIRRAFTTRVTI
ncbi:MAG: PDZ domain-containing protein [Gemmatimonadaceae bacterium]